MSASTVEIKSFRRRYTFAAVPPHHLLAAPEKNIHSMDRTKYVPMKWSGELYEMGPTLIRYTLYLMTSLPYSHGPIGNILVQYWTSTLTNDDTIPRRVDASANLNVLKQFEAQNNWREYMKAE